MTRRFHHLLSVREHWVDEICMLCVNTTAACRDCWWPETYRQTTLMLVEDAMMDDPFQILVRYYDQCRGIWLMFGIRGRTVVEV